MEDYGFDNRKPHKTYSYYTRNFRVGITLFNLVSGEIENNSKRVGTAHTAQMGLDATVDLGLMRVLLHLSEVSHSRTAKDRLNFIDFNLVCQKIEKCAYTSRYILKLRRVRRIARCPHEIQLANSLAVSRYIRYYYTRSRLHIHLE